MRLKHSNSDVQEGRVQPKLKLCPDVLKEPTLIVGAGICGAACALALAQLNLKSILLDQRSESELFEGMGINLQRDAILALNDLGISTETLLEAGISIQAQCYYCPDGRNIVSLDKSGKTNNSSKNKDNDTPGQIAIHRGKLLQLLHDKVGTKSDLIEVMHEHKVLNVEDSGEKIIVNAQIAGPQQSSKTGAISFDGSMLLGTDGINSNIRQHSILEKTTSEEDPRTFHGITHYRGVAKDFPSFLDGKTMIICGGLQAKMVIYPITNPKRGKQDINWIACMREDQRDMSKTTMSNPSYSHHNHVLDFLSSNEFHLDFLDLTSMVKSSPQIQAWPMVDLEPLDTWTKGRIAIAGDAAHSMLPVGSGGAMAALLDVMALKDAFMKSGPVTAADVLRLFQSMRYQDASIHQKKCRQQPAEKIVEEILKDVPKESKVPLEYADRITREMKRLHSPPKTASSINNSNVVTMG